VYFVHITANNNTKSNQLKIGITRSQAFTVIFVNLIVFYINCRGLKRTQLYLNPPPPPPHFLVFAMLWEQIHLCPRITWHHQQES
jgi:hypothetical protein